jgi:hypothetical protein
MRRQCYPTEAAIIETTYRWGWMLDKQVRLAMDAKYADELLTQQVHEKECAEAEAVQKAAHPCGGEYMSCCRYTCRTNMSASVMANEVSLLVTLKRKVPKFHPKTHRRSGTKTIKKTSGASVWVADNTQRLEIVSAILKTHGLEGRYGTGIRGPTLLIDYYRSSGKLTVDSDEEWSFVCKNIVLLSGKNKTVKVDLDFNSLPPFKTSHAAVSSAHIAVRPVSDTYSV